MVIGFCFELDSWREWHSPFSAYKHAHNPQFFHLFWRRVNARNISFETLYCGQFTLSIDNNKLPCYTLPLMKYHSFFRLTSFIHKFCQPTSKVKQNQCITGWFQHSLKNCIPLMILSPMTAESDWHLISPHNITPESIPKVSRMKGINHQLKKLLILEQILLDITIGNV